MANGGINFMNHKHTKYSNDIIEKVTGTSNQNSIIDNEHYIYSDEKQLAFGCSDDYFSLVLEDDFYSGYSKTTQTYKNPVLNGKEKFIIIKLELWAFQEK